MGNFEVVEFATLSADVQNLIIEATEIRKRAYVPYSNFAVGAAILTEEDSKVYSGCNIENAALSPSICAERAALPKAVCDGYVKFKTVAVVAHQEGFTAPCGVCRQALSEFCGTNGDIDIVLSRPTMDKVLCVKLSQLLPISFVARILSSEGDGITIPFVAEALSALSALNTGSDLPSSQQRQTHGTTLGTGTYRMSKESDLTETSTEAKCCSI